MVKYHIHIDGTEMPDQVYQGAKVLGFVDHHFTGHPAGYRHFEPNVHMTVKPETKEAFDHAWADIEALLYNSGFIGYVEGEYIRSDVAILENPYCDIPVPFRIERRRLRPEEQFRQTEFHLVMDSDASEQELVTKLLDAGLYGAYLPKQGYRAIVLSMQGFIADILPLQAVLRLYLEESGGARRATLQEERALRHQLFGISQNELPEIADTIQYHE